MAVKTYIASGATDPTNPRQQPLPAETIEGHVKALISTQSIANGDSIASTVKFGSVPSNARLLRNSTLDHDAITGLTTFDIGIGQTVGGVYTAQSVNCLMAAQTLAAASNKPALGAVDIVNLPKAAWQIAGYANDPGGVLDIVGTMNAAATAQGDMTLTLLFATP